MLNRYYKGITFVETMLVVGILAVVVTIAVPTFNGQISRSVMSDAMRSLHSSIQMAQSISQSQSSSVIICVGTSTGCNASTSWQNGWVVFIDADGSGKFSGGDQLLRVQPKFDTNLKLSTLPVKNKVTFDASGEPDQVGSFYACEKKNPKNSDAIGLIMSPIGHLRVATDDDNNKVINLHSGGNVSC